MSNRATWTITAFDTDGSLTLRGRRPTDLRTLPRDYARRHVELAYATTVYGAQGETTHTAHLILGEHSSAASAYVAMTRGRKHNIAHLVAEDDEDARRQWEEVFARDRADRGPTAATQQALAHVERYGIQRPDRSLEEVLGVLWAAWSREAELQSQHRHLVEERDNLQQVAAIHARYAPHRDRLHLEEAQAGRNWRQTHQHVDDLDAARQAETRDLQARVRAAWREDLTDVRHAAEIVRNRAGRLG